MRTTGGRRGTVRGYRRQVPTIHWFRRDLRLADNPALLAAVEQARAADDEVVPLFVVDPALWRSAGAPRLAYLARSLRALDESLGGRLVVRHGRASDVVPAVAREVDAPRRARHRGDRALRSAARRRRRAGARGAAGPHRLAVRRRARPADDAGRHAVPGVHPVPRRVARPRLVRPRAPTAADPVGGRPLRRHPRRARDGRATSRRPGNAPRTHAGRSTCTTGSPSTPPCATDPTSTAPRCCRSR